MVVMQFFPDVMLELEASISESLPVEPKETELADELVLDFEELIGFTCNDTFFVEIGCDMSKL